MSCTCRGGGRFWKDEVVMPWEGSVWVEVVCEHVLHSQCIYLWEERSMRKVGRERVSKCHSIGVF